VRSEAAAEESPVTDVGLGDGGGVVLDDDCAGGALPAAGIVADVW